jgi:hypothetical protein
MDIARISFLAVVVYLAYQNGCHAAISKQADNTIVQVGENLTLSCTTNLNDAELVAFVHDVQVSAGCVGYNGYEAYCDRQNDVGYLFTPVPSVNPYQGPYICSDDRQQSNFRSVVVAIDSFTCGIVEPASEIIEGNTVHAFCAVNYSTDFYNFQASQGLTFNGSVVDTLHSPTGYDYILMPIVVPADGTLPQYNCTLAFNITQVAQGTAFFSIVDATNIPTRVCSNATQYEILSCPKNISITPPGGPVLFGTIFTCTAFGGNPTPNYTWVESVTGTVGYGPTFELPETGPEYNYTYSLTCTVESNSVPNCSLSQTVEGNATKCSSNATIFRVKTDGTREQVFNGTVFYVGDVLECDGNGYPVSEITWVYDGVPVPQITTDDQFVFNDTGTHTLECRANPNIRLCNSSSVVITAEPQAFCYFEVSILGVIDIPPSVGDPAICFISNLTGVPDGAKINYTWQDGVTTRERTIPSLPLNLTCFVSVADGLCNGSASAIDIATTTMPPSTEDTTTATTTTTTPANAASTAMPETCAPCTCPSVTCEPCDPTATPTTCPPCGTETPWTGSTISPVVVSTISGGVSSEVYTGTGTFTPEHLPTPDTRNSTCPPSDCDDDNCWLALILLSSFLAALLAAMLLGCCLYNCCWPFVAGLADDVCSEYDEQEEIIEEEVEDVCEEQHIQTTCPCQPATLRNRLSPCGDPTMYTPGYRFERSAYSQF